MKKYIPLLGLVLILAACQKENEVKDFGKVNADFSIGDTLLKAYQNVEFISINDSNAIEHSWDFGDGFTTNEKIPVHYYTIPGQYVIKLTTTGKSGVSATSLQYVRIGERCVYEITLNSLASAKWYSDQGNWDEDSTGVSALPDVYFTISENDGSVLFESGTIYNMDQNRLPLSFTIPDMKISSLGNIGIGSTGIYLNDRDGAVSENMASNLMSGVSCNNDTYDKINHTGEFTVGFFSEFTVKYKIR